MRIIFDIHIASNTPNQHHETLRKEFETDFIPPYGAEIEDPAWSECRVPKSYSINYHDNYVHLNFGVDTFTNEQRCSEVVNGYRFHGWKPVLEWKK